MKPDCWKLLDDDLSAVDNGTPFRLSYFTDQEERFLYFKTKEEAFTFAQDHSAIDHIEIKNLETEEMLFPRRTP